MKKLIINHLIVLIISSSIVSCIGAFEKQNNVQKRKVLDMVIGKMNQKDLQNVFQCFSSAFENLKANETLRIINPESDGKREAVFKMGVDNLSHTQKQYKFSKEIQSAQRYFKQCAIDDPKNQDYVSLINMDVLTSYLKRNPLDSEVHDVVVFGKPNIPDERFKIFFSDADSSRECEQKIRFHIILVNSSAYHNNFSNREQLLKNVGHYIQKQNGEMFTFETSTSELSGRLNNDKIKPYAFTLQKEPKPVNMNSMTIRLEWDNIGQTDLDLCVINSKGKDSQILNYSVEGGKVQWGEHKKSSNIKTLKKCWEEINLYNLKQEDLLDISVLISHDNGQAPKNAVLRIYGDKDSFVFEKAISCFEKKTSYKKRDKKTFSLKIKDVLHVHKSLANNGKDRAI